MIPDRDDKKATREFGYMSNNDSDKDDDDIDTFSLPSDDDDYNDDIEEDTDDDEENDEDVGIDAIDDNIDDNKSDIQRSADKEFCMRGASKEYNNTLKMRMASDTKPGSTAKLKKLKGQKYINWRYAKPCLDYTPERIYNDSRFSFRKDRLPKKIESFDEITVFRRMFFDDKIVDLLVNETNAYHERCQRNPNWKRVTKEEMIRWHGIATFMSLVKFPRIDMYWDNNPQYETRPVRKCMSLKRFRQIRDYLHFNDDDTSTGKNDMTGDRMHKLRKTLEHLANVFSKWANTGLFVSFDEGIVGGYMVFYLVSKIKSKPKSSGIKIWILCDPTTGYIFRIIVNDYQHDTMKDYGIGESSCLNIMRGIQKGTFVAIDKFFTSPKLAAALLKRGYYAIGTVKIGRVELPKARMMMKSIKYVKGSMVTLMNINIKR
jgi:hypothetical protein